MPLAANHQKAASAKSPLFTPARAHTQSWKPTFIVIS